MTGESRVKSFLIGVIITLVAALVFVLVDLRNHRASAVETHSASRSEEEQRTIDIYKATNEAVAFITTISLVVDPNDLFLEVQPREGTGSGIVVDARKGIILTNLHVIQHADKIEISLADGQNYRARLVGTDQELDIAVLQLRDPPAHLTAMTFGDSSKLEVGQRVLAIGNPFGLNRTLTEGIVSSLDRVVRHPSGVVMKGLLQTDAAINPGNSGGPLIDLDGHLVGINTAILSQSGDSAGIGFAVPINQIRRVLPELIATGKVLRPKMGWILADTNQGAMVRRVLAGGPAAQAGLAPIERPVQDIFLQGFIRDYAHADLIVAVNGKTVSTADEVEDLVAQSDASKEIALTVRRGGQKGADREVKLKPVLG